MNSNPEISNEDIAIMVDKLNKRRELEGQGLKSSMTYIKKI